MDALGLRLTEARIHTVVHTAWRAPFSTKADFARSNADYIAIAADQNLMTTRALDGEYGRQWLATPKGLTFLWRNRKDK